MPLDSVSVEEQQIGIAAAPDSKLFLGLGGINLTQAAHSLSFLYYRYDRNTEKFRLPYLPGLSELERSFAQVEDDVYQALVLDGWWLLSIPISILYVAGAFTIQTCMKKRERFTLRGPLILWNLMLAIFSIIGTIRVAPEAIDMLLTKGLYGTVCSPRYMSGDPMLWAWLFVMSKVPEMGDTLFIVLRKQKLIFLHWYHHLVTFWYCLLCYLDQTAAARWFMVMNYFVHSVMYTYYFLKAARLCHVPRQISMCITMLQLSQMVVGMAVSFGSLYLLNHSIPCDVSYTTIYTSLLMYFSYVILFANFFYNAYKPYIYKFLESRRKNLVSDSNGFIVQNGHISKESDESSKFQNGAAGDGKYESANYPNGVTLTHRRTQPNNNI